MRKIYLLPNLVTTGNMFCGFYSVVAAIHLDFVAAAWAIVVAAIFDSLDGRIARLAKATSAFGVQYDSLSDLISFGFAPAILLYQWALEPYGRLGWMVSFLFLACAAFRLARFNVTTDSLPKNYFQGLPSPTAAGAVATYVIFHYTMNWPRDFLNHTPSILLALGVSSLMVSTIPFPSFKEFNWRSRTSFGLLFVFILSFILILVKPEVTLFFLLCLYILSGITWSLFKLVMPTVSLSKEMDLSHEQKSKKI